MLKDNDCCALWCRKQLEGEGMVLPFEPMTMTFKDLHYWVQIPKVIPLPMLKLYDCPCETQECNELLSTFSNIIVDCPSD